MKNKYSLFIGRFQPLHAGHKALIQKVLDEGKDVLVAIRDTELSDSNPYTFEQRKLMFLEHFGDLVTVIEIPDIEEVCFGRKVGWGIREIRLDNAIEEISATNIRADMAKAKK